VLQSNFYVSLLDIQDQIRDARNRLKTDRQTEKNVLTALHITFKYKRNWLWALWSCMFKMSVDTTWHVKRLNV